MSNIVTLSQLRDEARRRADMVNSTFVSDTEINDFINESLLELYDILTQKFADEYFHTFCSFPIGSTTNIYPLPGDYYKMKGVEIAAGGGNNRFVTLTPYMFNERNRFAYNTTQLPSRTVRIRYVPRNPRLTDTPYTFTSANVDSSTDTITVNDHQMSTGELISFTTSGVLPAGLSTGITYFPIRVSDNTFKVASTLQNSFSETALDITDGGTGTHTLINNKDRFDFINGYESYVVWRAVEMMKEKEESDVTTSQSNIGRAMQRIESAAGNRDSSMPNRIVDMDDINDIELRIFQETNIKYRVLGRNIEFIYIGYLGV